MLRKEEKKLLPQEVLQKKNQNIDMHNTDDIQTNGALDIGKTVLHTLQFTYPVQCRCL